MATSRENNGPTTKDFVKGLIQSTCFLLLLCGVGILAYSGFRYIRDAGGRVPVISFYGALRGEQSVLTLVARFSVGSACLPIGFAGFWGSALEKRWLIGTFIFLLSLAVIANAILTAYIAIFSYPTDPNTAVRIYRLIIGFYGNQGYLGMEFTSDLDKHQRENSCCGWDRNSKSGANAFGRSPWFAIAAAAAAAASGSNSSLTRAAAIPASCCRSTKKKKSEDENKDLMTKEKVEILCGGDSNNISEAERLELVFPDDCLRQLETCNRILFVVGLGIMAAITGTEIACIVFACALLRLLSRRDLPPASADKLGTEQSGKAQAEQLDEVAPAEEVKVASLLELDSDSDKELVNQDLQHKDLAP